MSGFTDANMFVRHLTQDDLVRSPAATRYLREVEDGLRTAWTTPVVVAEIVYVLTSSRTGYGLDRARVADALEPLIMLGGLAIDHKEVFPRAFALFRAHNADFVDCFHAALVVSRGESDVYSFDRDFDKLPGIRRLEP